jgi:RNA polymerase sigma factor (sigma-70 family)
MHGEPSTACDDSALLALWVKERRQDAFAQLVAAYQQMVVGAALRRTGDVEAARDVAQQVFSALAAKAPWLAGRTSIAGWLYVAASHVAMRAARSETRRHAAMERFSAEKMQEESVAWDKLEDALAALGETDREAIVLHYFQDLGYAEMAARLRIAEPAARKRVSRALGALEHQLARHGIRGTASLVLAGAVAQQTSAASVALTISSGAASVPWTLTISAMAKHTTTKVAASIAALMLIPLAFQWRANASAQAEIFALRENLPTAGDGGISAARGEERLAALQAEVAAARSAADAAEKRLGELAELKRRVESEVVYSLGSLEKMARKLAQFIRISEAMDAAKGKRDPSTELAVLARELRFSVVMFGFVRHPAQMAEREQRRRNTAKPLGLGSSKRGQTSLA